MVLEEVISLQSNILLEIGVILILATVLAYITRLLRQPLIPAYIVAGLILGPLLGLVTNIDVVQALSEIGIVFLLFIIGVEIDLKQLKKVSGVTIGAGVIQVLLTFVAGYFASVLLGWSSVNCIYAGLILAFSSTMIVIKLLSDENEVETLHGRIIIGILFLQDLFVILALSVLGTKSFNLSLIAIAVLKGLSLVALAFLFSKLIVFRLFKFAAKSEELLFLLALSVCFFFSLLAYVFDFSLAIGAFLGGLTLANLPYNLNIISRINPLKDFFATIFFVTLGMQIIPISFGSLFTPLMVFLGITLLVKPLIIFLVITFAGYGKKIGFLSAASLAQISEFSLIIAVAGKDLISQELFTITIVLAILSITLTTYIIKYRYTFYSVLRKPLKLFDYFENRRYKDMKPQKSKEILVFGCHRVGTHILRVLPPKKTLVVDHNPEVIEFLKSKKMNAMYGDMTNEDLLKRINFDKVKLIVSTIPDSKDSMYLVKYLKSKKFKGKIIVTSNHLKPSLDLYDVGADYVIEPQIMAGHSLEYILKRVKGKRALRKMRNDHIKTIIEIDAETNPKKKVSKKSRFDKKKKAKKKKTRKR